MGAQRIGTIPADDVAKRPAKPVLRQSFFNLTGAANDPQSSMIGDEKQAMGLDGSGNMYRLGVA